jgi:YVTN family beta-propeller protein
VASESVSLQLLGPVEATFDGRRIPLGAAKQRALLAMLALEANAAVSRERLVHGLWGDDPPATADKMVQLYVSQLRRLLDGSGAEIVTRGPGYELCVDTDAVDVARFESLVAEGAPRAALGLWRGDALADVSREPFAGPEIRRLEGLRARAFELMIDDDLAAGRADAAIAQLERLIEADPLREHLHAQRMLALYRSGRQAEALAAYHAARRRLVDEIGIEPGPELREMHERILQQDPALECHARARGRVAATAGLAYRTPRRPLIALSAAAALLAAGGFGISRLAGPDELRPIDEGTVAVVDTTRGAITAGYRVGGAPGAVAVDAGAVWVADTGAGTVARVDGDGVDTIDVGAGPVGLAVSGGSLWVAVADDGAVAQVDPVARRVVQRIPAGNGLRALAAGDGAVWALAGLDGALVRIDVSTGRTTRFILGGRPSGVAVGAGGVWVADEESGSVIHVDPRSGDAAPPIAVGHDPGAVAVGLGAVWVANREDGTVARIDPATDRVTHTLPVGKTPVALAAGSGALWIADAGGTIRRLDPATRMITDTIRIKSTPAGLALAGRALWVSASAAPGAHRGGTLRIGRPPTSGLDPAVGGYEAPAVGVLALAYDTLVEYRRATGAAGARLVGGLAREVPAPADDGRRYVFRLRRGIRYSDGTTLRASDVRSSLERTLVVGRAHQPPLFDAIDGAAACRARRSRCDLSRSILANDRAHTLTLRLARPDPELLWKLAMPLAAIVPAATPRRKLLEHPPPGTGPYRIEPVVRGRATLTRNPHFRSRSRPPGNADRIEVEFAADAHAALTAQAGAALRGELDVVEVLSAANWRELRTRAGARLRTGSAAETVYAWLNVRGPPFDDVRVRRALNLAIDRAHIVTLTKGPEAATPTCQVLPPDFPGYRPHCPFTAAQSATGAWSAPDLARARRLVAAAGAIPVTIAIWSWPDLRPVAEYLARVLGDLGFRTRVRISGDYFTKAASAPDDVAQMGVTGWLADFPDPSGFMRPILSCHAVGTTNLSRFCDRGLDRAITRAQAAAPDHNTAWLRIERRIADASPIVPLVSQRRSYITSPRVGNARIHLLTGLLFDEVWVN